MDKMNARKKAARAARLRKQRTRRALLTLCLMLAVAVVSVGGTIAWLTDKTDAVVNTFTSADIDITLTETPNNGNSWTAQLVPGKKYDKNPKVTVVGDANDVEAYLFVKFEAETSADYLNYELAMNATNSGWTLVGENTNVWYRVVAAATPYECELLVGNQVTVKPELTEEQVQNATFDMTFTAYAIQTEGFETAELAWAEVSK